MSDVIIVALISFAGTAVGSGVSVVVTHSLTKYRIDELTKQVEKHNKIIERTYELEKRADVVDEQIKVANHRIQDLEAKV